MSWPLKSYSAMTDEEKAEQDRKAAEQNERWRAHQEEKRRVRRERRGYPDVKQRPKCICGCGRRLDPDFKVISTAENAYQETTELRGWKGVGNVFKTNICAIRYALKQAAAKEAKAWNELTIRQLNESREKGQR